ncbi:MAG: AraC family transcriptional regulator [Planctomycetota bacterium]
MRSYAANRYKHWVRRAEAPTKLIAECESRDSGCYLVKSFVLDCADAPPTDDLVLFVPIRGSGRREISLDHGFGRFWSRPRTGNFIVKTPGIASEASGSGPFEMLTVCLPWASIQHAIGVLTGDKPDHLPIALHSHGWHDNDTFQLMLKLWRSVESQLSHERLGRDEIVLQITERLLWLGGTELPQSQFSAVLARQTLSNVIDYIASHFSGPISLQELSSVAGCSEFHFSRLFRNSMGYSPIEYLIRFRIERLREALSQDASRSLASLAVEHGFSDQSHMGRHFKRVFGFSPMKGLARDQALLSSEGKPETPGLEQGESPPD